MPDPKLTLVLLAKDKASGSLKSMGKALGGLGKAGAVAGLAGAAALGALAVGATKLAIDAAKVDAVRGTFQNLAASIGEQALPMLEKMRTATRGMVDDAGLMQAANKFVSMGIAESSGKAAEFAEMATQLGMAMGKEAGPAMEEFALLLANQSIPRLDTYGISAGKVRARIEELQAANAGLTREAAFQQATLEQGRIALAKVGEQGESTAAKMARLQAGVKNAGDIIGGAFLPALDEAMGGMGRFIETVNAVLRPLAAGFAATFKQVAALVKQFVRSLIGDSSWDQLATDAEGWGANVAVQFANGIAKATSYVLTALTKLGQAVANMLRPGSAPKLLPDLMEWGAGAATAYMDGWSNADFGVFKDLQGIVEGYLRNLPKGAIPAEQLALTIGDVRSAITEAVTEFSKVGRIGPEAMKKIESVAKLLPESVLRYVRELNNLRAAEDAVKRAQDELNRVTRVYDDRLKPLNAKLQQIIGAQNALRDAERDAQLRATAAGGDRLTQIDRERQALRDTIRLKEIDAEMADEETTAEEQSLLMLEQEEIALRAAEAEKQAARDAELAALQLQQQGMEGQIDAVEAEKTAAVTAEEAKVAAAEAALAKQQETLAAIKSMIDAQRESNQLYNEQFAAVETLNSALAGLGGAIGGLGEAMTTAMPKGGILAGLFDPAKDGKGMFAGLEEKVADAFSGVQGQMEDMVGTWQGIFENNKIGEVWGAIWTEIKAKAETEGAAVVSTVLGALGESLWTAITTPFTTWWTNFTATWAEVFRLTGEIWTEIVRIIDEGLTIIVTSADTAWIAVKSAVTTKWAEIKSEIFNTWELIKFDLAAALLAVSTALTTVWGEIKTEIETKWGEFKTAIEGKWEEIKEAIGTKLEEVKQKIIDFKENLVTAGESLISGLIDGIGNKAQALIDKAKGAVSSAIQAAKNLLGIASPSKVFEDMGQNMIAGLMQGWDQQAASLGTTISDTMGAITTPPLEVMRPGGGGIGGGAMAPSHITLDINFTLDGQPVGHATVETSRGDRQALDLRLSASSKSV